MITLHKSGSYKLFETKHNTKILYLDNDIYAWVEAAGNFEILVSSHNIHRSDYILSMGHYNIYEVEDEAFVSDHTHLELEVGAKIWQGYILLTGLPDVHKLRSRIIATREIITGNPRFRRRKDIHSNLAL